MGWDFLALLGTKFAIGRDVQLLIKNVYVEILWIKSSQEILQIS